MQMIILALFIVAAKIAIAFGYLCWMLLWVISVEPWMMRMRWPSYDQNFLSRHMRTERGVPLEIGRKLRECQL